MFRGRNEVLKQVRNKKLKETWIKEQKQSIATDSLSDAHRIGVLAAVEGYFAGKHGKRLSRAGKRRAWPLRSALPPNRRKFGNLLYKNTYKLPTGVNQ